MPHVASNSVSAGAPGTPGLSTSFGAGGSTAGGLAARSTSARSLAPDEILQAVVVADSFNRRFRPLTLDTPRCLLPLVNKPLIEYTLELLAASGVQEIFVVCCSHANQIKDYIRKSRWSKSSVPYVSVIVSQELRSMGDVLRDLDTKQILQSDFILVSGDVVSNIHLHGAVEAHKQRRVKDKNAIMTMMMRQACPDHPTRAKGEERLFVLDAKTHECVHYETMVQYPSKRKLRMDPDIFKTHPDVMIRNDLIDCQIDVCSLDVLALFTENFDYQDMRSDFLKGILESDLLGKLIYCHVVEDGYAARVSSQQMYHAMSRDIMSRWVYPIVPDNSMYNSHSYMHSRMFVYKETGVQLARSAQILEHVTIGGGTRVGDKTVITSAVIGRQCWIGDHVSISDSYVMDNVVIGEQCVINKCMVGEGVVLKDNVVLGRGCILGPGVVIGPDVTLPDGCRVSLRRVQSSGIDTDPFSDDESIANSIADESISSEENANGEDGGVFLGAEARGHVFVDDLEDDDDEDTDPRNIAAGFLGYEAPQTVDAEAESGADTDGEAGGSTSGGSVYGGRARSGSISSGVSGGHGREDSTGALLAEDTWEIEVKQTLERAFTDNHTVDIAALELNTLKMAMNITFDDLRQVVVPAILNKVETESTGAPASSIGSIVRGVITKWGPLITKFTHSAEDQIRVLDAVAVYTVSYQPAFDRMLVYVLRFLYDVDVVIEEVLMVWYRRLPANVNASVVAGPTSLIANVDVGGLVRVRELAAPLIKWLEEAEEDDDDEEDDD